jgi:FkbM family methyltransferase
MHARAHSAALALARSLSGVRLRGVARLFSLVAPAALGRGPQLVECADGFRVVADPSDYLSAMLVYGRYSRDIISVMRALVRPGDHVIDVGAHVGFLSSHLAQLVGTGGAVYSMEPDPVARPRLEACVEANGYRQIHVIPLAASDCRGSIQFQAHKDLGHSTAVVRPNHPGFTDVKVDCAPIDELLREGRIAAPISFVKIDVEGYECAVLDGMKDLLSRDRPVVITEVNPEMLSLAGRSAQELFGRFVRLDYRLLSIASAPGWSATRVQLNTIDPEVDSPFCDALCIPSERAIPEGLCVG